MMSGKSGKLIVFEGIDGTGKSTQCKELARALEQRGVVTRLSYEPTHGVWGKQLRDSANTGRFSLEEEIDLFIKDRREHVSCLIVPALERGEWVILDRYYFSMMAYQGARGYDVEQIRRMNEEFAPCPDLVVWLDIPVSVALERIGVRGSSDAFEAEEMLQACYEIFANIKEEWFKRVDASASVEEVTKRVKRCVTESLLFE